MFIFNKNLKFAIITFFCLLCLNVQEAVVYKSLKPFIVKVGYLIFCEEKKTIEFYILYVNL